VNKNGLQYFGVVREKSKVNIFWQVAASENNKYFEVQRSINGSEYQTIAVVYAKDAETFGADYSFTDQQFEKLDSKKFWYRVKRVDPLGLEYFSAIKEVDLLRETKGSYISIHPNPFNTTVQVKFESEKIRKVDLRVTTEKGLIMVEDTFQVRTGYNNVPIEAEYLIPGIYFIEIRSEGTLIEKLKVVKQ
jgi:Secretion system C-terminal sorting domain